MNEYDGLPRIMPEYLNENEFWEGNRQEDNGLIKENKSITQ